MANNSGVKIHHDPIWFVRNLYNKHAHLKSGNGRTSKETVAPRGTAASLTAVQDVRRNPSWAELSLPSVISKLRSSEHSIVLQAVDELRARGHLSDNTLSWAYLRYANLQGADLSGSNLKNADLERAIMEMADLSHANLSDARFTRASLQSANLDKASLDGANLVGAKLQGAKNVSNEQLALASRMRVSILPDGNLYDGRFNLPGDFADAIILHIDLNDPAAIASFYGVSLEDFMHGQEWRQVNMPSVSAWHESVCYRNAELIMKWL